MSTSELNCILWYDRECYVTKLKTRRLEKAYRRHPNPSALTLWRTQFNRQRSLYQNKFINHWSEKINSSNGNGKALWAHLNCLLTRPKITTTTHSANSFADHFTQKIRRIRHSTSGYSTPTISDRSADVPLATFRPVSADEVAALINKSPAKQCPLDPLPTWLLKDICDTISPVIAMMCNASISQNKFPQGQKSAIVRPLLKKTTLDPSDLNSFRPISNLSFVSKLLERIIDIRFTQHADQYNLFSPVQSAYRKFHSIETAHDLITTVDEGRVALTLLDLSA